MSVLQFIQMHGGPVISIIGLAIVATCGIRAFREAKRFYSERAKND
ncbi:hypothetical protein JQX09_17820 [Sulfitobacter pseudonitzschiae]|uniref:Uncharacterized protein n=1 Tax=Pseudosulfitobacter pseudonitzschiae TaxID=1402135 RepID=A0A9Q2NQJ2_9RHOB|nr:hypothetical protein [Pseudosulfitobacter pseudonitzschiae]MBM2293789.1 hypothetical protein [Pseudosulfitobacter pseudonitzschiae]MBM2298707.1 hypothetical protein [Pseudosulfitobacter pseudonitzschiae]MBM2303621.1 hypothetical protein [Pseudosulfitobacter pseudonitzschiae]MBM2313404.1 hypothetical protein [Pseudosulfitobacter pseudonitzschiae]MBM2318317.1 hypothetical protein [Pseudosulfitobacter pseudonitzschiae]